ncbi:MAG: hypothetical protein J1F35_08130 [Erysipelotrichales bacterium]|nr:hypothetical protein [Erysipelotrichales bacterium]
MKTLKEFILDSLISTKLFEQAYNREQIIRTVINLANQIVENWALILYVRQYDKENLNLNHWKSELEAHCEKIDNMNIKGNSDKKKAFKQALIRNHELNDSSQVFKILKRKFKKENIDEDICKDISFQISQNIEDLVNALSDKNGPYDWIENL